MAIKTLKSAKGVVELNHVAAVKTGQIEAQYDLDAALTEVENGMLLVADHVAKKVKKPAGATDLVYLHASVEKDYEGKGRKNFSVKAGEFLPRLLKLHVGDKFETNCVEHDDAVYANYAAIVAAINATTVYGVPNASGNIRIVATAAGTEKVVLKVVEGVTLPNGEQGLKFVVEKNQ
jgi:hypothetical protein